MTEIFLHISCGFYMHQRGWDILNSAFFQKKSGNESIMGGVYWVGWEAGHVFYIPQYCCSGLGWRSLLVYRIYFLCSLLVANINSHYLLHYTLRFVQNNPRATSIHIIAYPSPSVLASLFKNLGNPHPSSIPIFIPLHNQKTSTTNPPRTKTTKRAGYPLLCAPARQNNGTRNST